MSFRLAQEKNGGKTLKEKKISQKLNLEDTQNQPFEEVFFKKLSCSTPQETHHAEPHHRKNIYKNPSKHEAENRGLRKEKPTN